MISMLILLRCDGFSVSTLLLKPGTDRGSGDRLAEKAGPAPVAAKRRRREQVPASSTISRRPGSIRGDSGGTQ